MSDRESDPTRMLGLVLIAVLVAFFVIAPIVWWLI